MLSENKFNAQSIFVDCPFALLIECNYSIE